MPRKFKLRSDRSEVFLNGRFYTDKDRIFSETKEVIKRFESGFLEEIEQAKPKTTKKK